MPVTYAPAESGGWLAVVCERRVVLIGGDPDADTIAKAWELSSDAGSQATLELLTSHGLAATPPFALVEPAGDSIRVIVRGDAAVTAEGAEPVSGVGVATWVERMLSAPGVEVIVSGATGGPALPLVEGVVRAARVTFGAVQDEVSSETLVIPRRRTTVTPPQPPAGAPEAASQAEPHAQHQPISAETIAVDRPAASDLVVVPAGIAMPPQHDDPFDATMLRTTPEAGSATGGYTGDDRDDSDDGDHDGHTVVSSDIAGLRGRSRPESPQAPPPPVAASVVVVLPDGTREPLTTPLLVGRSPSVSNVPGTQMPKLVTLGGGDQDISRTHARISLEGGTIVITDLHSRNGTSVIMPGKEPMKLRAGEPTPVIIGSTIDLGGGVMMTVVEG